MGDGRCSHGPQSAWASEAGRGGKDPTLELQEAASLDLDFLSQGRASTVLVVHLAVAAPWAPDRTDHFPGASTHPAKPGAEGAGATPRAPAACPLGPHAALASFPQPACTAGSVEEAQCRACPTAQTPSCGVCLLRPARGAGLVRCCLPMGVACPASRPPHARSLIAAQPAGRPWAVRPRWGASGCGLGSLPWQPAVTPRRGRAAWP